MYISDHGFSSPPGVLKHATHIQEDSLFEFVNSVL